MSSSANELSTDEQICLLPRDATHCAERGYEIACCLKSVRLSVCPSVTFRYRDHIGWNSSKIISRPCACWPQHGQSGATGTPPKLGRNMGGVMST